MKNYIKLILAFAGILVGIFPAYSQEDEEFIKKYLTEEVEIENPVYMPVLGAGIGFFNFYGNVNNAFNSTFAGKPGLRVNLATYLDRKNHYFRGNLVFMTGELSGTQRSTDDPSKNLNFKSNIYSFGLNVHYSFKPWIKGKYFEPFISAGLETLQFDSKTDLVHKSGYNYHYWTDGTIRNAPEGDPNANIVSRDYIYDTDLRSHSLLGKYNQLVLSIPVDVGFDFNVSERVTLRAATSLHYAFTDKIDDLSSINPDYKKKSGNNMYTFSYLSLHLDLFSEDKYKILDLIYADIEDYDYIMDEDEDGDGVFDGRDLCPGTPEGIPVDSVGCPLDSDRDGVPDYMDREPNSRPSAIVDEYGVEINENMVIEVLNLTAINRRDVESYLTKQQNKPRRGEALRIPDKFKKVDTNGDGYISYDELLKAINDYFDGKSTYSPDEIQELKDLFFVQ